MKESISKFSKIRNIGTKTVLAFIGLILISSQVYPFILKGFMLTEKVEIWDKTEWILLLVGFFLAVGAAKYNTVLDLILNKFSNSKTDGKNV